MNFKGGARYGNPQAWIDKVVAQDAILKNVRLSHPPRYSSQLRHFGLATRTLSGFGDKTLIGRKSLVSRAELIDTIIHEELHHRIWKRAMRGLEKDMMRIGDRAVEEAYVEAATSRFMRMKGLSMSQTRDNKLIKLLDLILEASAESVQTLSCPFCNGGLSIQFVYIQSARNPRKSMSLHIHCKKCPWDSIADGLPKQPPWVRRLGPKIQTLVAVVDGHLAGKKRAVLRTRGAAK
jgi:hypothetical protein